MKKHKRTDQSCLTPHKWHKYHAKLNKDKKGKIKNLKTRMFQSAGTVIAAEVLSPVIKTLIEQTKSNCIHTVSIKDSYDNIQHGLFKYFDNYDDCLSINHLDDFEPIKYKKDIMWSRGANFQKIIMYHGVPIMMKSTYNPEYVEGSTKSKLVLSTFNTEKCIKTLKMFIEECYKMSMTNLNERIREYGQLRIINDYNNVDFVDNRKLRTFDDVFIPSSVYHQIMDPVKKYVESYDFYESSNIPNHFGILLYSDPGTGKSSIAQAIANEINAIFYVTSGDNIRYIGDIIRNHIGINPVTKSTYRVLCIEDVDSGLNETTRMLRSRLVNDDDTDSDDDKCNRGLATILNAFDGAASPKNVIYIMTTNHKNKLDPALIRPGRCDICVEIPSVCPETLKEFIDKYFPGNDITPTHVGEGLTFATLQVELLKGKTAQEIVEFASVYKKGE